MNTRTSRLARLFFGLCAIGMAQSNYYVASHSATLIASVDTVTVQSPATGARQVKFRGALVSCSSATAAAPCTFTLKQNGAAATATALAVTPLNLSPTAAAVAFSSSNVGAGTTIHAYTLTSSGDFWIGLGPSCPTCGDGFFLGSGANSNLSITTGSVTATTSIALFFSETGN